jgi:hypothetical protein
MLVDQGQHGLEARCGLRLLDGMNGGPLAPAIVERDLPYLGRELERDSEHRFFSLRLISCKSTFSALISRSRSSSTTAQIVAAVSYIGQGLAEFVNRFRAHRHEQACKRRRGHTCTKRTIAPDDAHRYYVTLPSGPPERSLQDRPANSFPLNSDDSQSDPPSSPDVPRDLALAAAIRAKDVVFVAQL